MTEPIITVRGLSKQYRIGPDTMDIVALTTLLGGPYRRLKDMIRPSAPSPGNSRNSLGKLFWALKDLNFDVHQGERIGIIGRNGSGKSTLLKILSRVVYPTLGEARIRGRVTSLLEVGTGFNDNLTGRGNIYLNASLHGLERDEIDAKLNEIIDFSEVRRFIDTPVKHYSSGMRMRLAFAVAAHIDPDILLLDEVLAVGDMSFQKKCLQRVEGLTSGGRTLLFVSHSMDAITRFCNRCIWLESGRIVVNGPVEDAITAYVKGVMGVRPSYLSVPCQDQTQSGKPLPATEGETSVAVGERGNRKDQTEKTGNDDEQVRLVSVRVINTDGDTVTTIGLNEAVGVEIVYDVLKKQKNIQPALHFKTVKQTIAFAVAYTDMSYMNSASEVGRYIATAWVQPNLLNVGLMYVNVAMVTPDPLERHIFVENAVSFNVHEPSDPYGTARGKYARDFPGVVRPLLRWETRRINAEGAATVARRSAPGAGAPDW